MFTEISNLPTGAVGVAASGRITNRDRKSILEPTIRSALSSGRRVRLLYMTAPDFAGYDGGAVFDDAVFGTRHFTDFAKIAFVSESAPYDRAVQALEGLMPASLRVFRPRELEAAKAWLAD